ncbi:MAG: pyridoxamine 5'-phosphate oxidase family protein [Bacteroidota bacterium]
MYEIWNDLSKAHQQLWGLLERATADPKSPFRTIILASTGADDVFSRIVILRKVQKQGAIMICHTDTRSEKIEQIKASPKVALLCWDPRKQLQVRIQAEAEVHYQDELANQEWLRLGERSRKNYSSQLEPGRFVDSFQEGIDAYRLVHGTEVDSRMWKAHFAVIMLRLTSIEWLWLDRTGHRRALYTRESNWEGRWMVP